MSNGSNLFTSAVISGAVFAALIASIANIIISIINNRMLKTIEKQKKIGEIDKYRYTCLYDILTRWYNHKFDFEDKYDEDHNNIGSLHTFHDILEWYNITKPFLDSQYITELDRIVKKEQSLNIEMCVARAHGKSYSGNSVEQICLEHRRICKILRHELEKSIHLQLESLMMKQ